jgi:hypothetical protein
MENMIVPDICARLLKIHRDKDFTLVQLGMPGQGEHELTHFDLWLLGSLVGCYLNEFGAWILLAGPCLLCEGAPIPLLPYRIKGDFY